MYMRIMICEDESVYAIALANAIMRWKTISHVINLEWQMYSSAEDLLEKLTQRERCDLLFLDIKMPDGMSGYDLAKQIRIIDQQVSIVFVTHYQDYAIQGYPLNILRYITKPFEDQQVFEVLDIVYRQLQLVEDQNIVVGIKGQQIVIPYREILFMESQAHNLKIFTTAKSGYIQTRIKIRDMMESIDNRLFIQTHRGFIVNVMYIRVLHQKQLSLADHSSIPISRKYLEGVRSAFSKYYLGN